MKLKHEFWLEEQTIDEETRELFLEGVRCYKAEAYRASFLFSYLGFQSMIKNIIMNSNKAEGFTQSEWDAKRRDIVHDDEKWEKKIQELVKDKKKQIFKLSEDVYNQYIYWKDRRNDCAHAKGNYISYPHVEAFWLFVHSNYPKFVVNGGSAFIVEQIKDHYDISKTPPGQDILPILSKIPLAVEKIEYRDIFVNIKLITPDVKVWKNLIVIGELRDSVINYLLEENNNTFSLQLFRNEPSIVKYFQGKNVFIRKTWMNFSLGYSDYFIFIEMLRNSLIPNDQLEEVFNKMFSKVSSDVFGFESWLIEKEIELVDRLILEHSGFYKEFYKQAFVVRNIVTNFNWANRNKELVCHYIKYFGLNNCIVETINDAFTTYYSPRELVNEIIDFYKKNPNIKLQHNEISKENGLHVPKILKIEEVEVPIEIEDEEMN